MKKHRWVVSVIMPAHFIKNEDGEWYVSTPEVINPNELPSMAWCYDCEAELDERFGQPCLGFNSTGAIDNRMPDDLWKVFTERFSQ